MKFFPNPVMGGKGNLEFVLNSPAKVTLRVYELSGKLVQTLVLGKKPEGKHKVEIATDGFESGTYFINLSSEEGSETLKFLVIR